MEKPVDDHLVGDDENVNKNKQKRTPQTSELLGLADSEKKQKICSETSESIDAVDEGGKQEETLISVVDEKKKLKICSAVDEEEKPGKTLISVVDEKKKQQMQPGTSELGHGKESEAVMNASVVSDQVEEVAYVEAAFRSICPNEVFIFTGQAYAVVNYDPCTAANDHLVKGETFIKKGFPTLGLFQSWGVSAAFSRHGTNRAFLFSHDECVEIKYNCDTKKGHQVSRKEISEWIPAFEGTTFEYRVDAAFESTEKDQAYLFSKTHYALINYIEESVIATGLIIDAFPCLENTMFERDIGAAFASHTPNEAYLFKDNNYARLYFTPGETKKSYIIEGPIDIVPSNWPSLKTILPFPLGLDGMDLSSSEDELENAGNDHLFSWSDPSLLDASLLDGLSMDHSDALAMVRRIFNYRG